MCRWEGGIPFVELKNSKISTSFYFSDIVPIFRIFKIRADRSQGFPGTHFVSFVWFCIDFERFD